MKRDAFMICLMKEVGWEGRSLLSVLLNIYIPNRLYQNQKTHSAHNQDFAFNLSCQV